MKTSSIRSVNWLYLIILVILLTLGSVMQYLHPFWGLIGTEVFIILLPALLFVRLGKLPLPETLRLRWTGGVPLLLGLLLGAGLWPLSMTLDGISALLFGYVPPAPFEIPTDLPGQALYIVALAFFAPICEEILFRGVILRAYERLRVPAAVLAVGLMFAFFHLRLQGLLALIPIALVLTWLAVATKSILPSILAHFSFNALSVGASLVLSADTNPLTGVWLGLLLGGLLLAIFCIILLKIKYNLRKDTEQVLALQNTPHDAETSVSMDGNLLKLPHPGGEQPIPKKSFVTLRWVLIGILPILIAACIYALVGGLEWYTMHSPDMLAKNKLVFSGSSWSRSTQYDYEMRNIVGDAVGNVNCQVSPGDGVVGYECTIKGEAFDVTQGSSRYLSGKYEEQVNFSWAISLPPDGVFHLTEYSKAVIAEYLKLSESAREQDGGLVLTVQSGNEPSQELAFQPDVVLNEEWQWRFSALAFDQVSPLGSSVQMAWGQRYDEKLKRSVPLIDTARVEVMGKEKVKTAGGVEYTCWKVVLSYKNFDSRVTETAWYDINQPHGLIKYDNGGGITYLLK